MRKPMKERLHSEELYLSGVISCPDCNSITDENRTHSQESGISKGTSSAMQTGSLFPIFS